MRVPLRTLAQPRRGHLPVAILEESGPGQEPRDSQYEKRKARHPGDPAHRDSMPESHPPISSRFSWSMISNWPLIPIVAGDSPILFRYVLPASSFNTIERCDIRLVPIAPYLYFGHAISQKDAEAIVFFHRRS